MNKLKDHIRDILQSKISIFIVKCLKYTSLMFVATQRHRALHNNHYLNNRKNEINEYLFFKLSALGRMMENHFSKHGRDSRKWWENHSLTKMLIVHILYNGIFYLRRMTLNVVAGGTLMNKPCDDVYAFIEDITHIHY